MENGKYNLVQGREILTQPTSYGAKRNPPLLPALHHTKPFFRFLIFFLFYFLGDFFSSQRERQQFRWAQSSREE